MLFGGAAGGGKSAALLMWALEGADTPGYAAILFRRTFPELEQPGGLISLSHQWGLAAKGAVWSAQKKLWTFPSGAVIKFDHMQHMTDTLKYQGGQYCRAGFDELTHFAEGQYDWIRSRLRRIREFPFPPSVRASSNPGGPGHLWVKSRFISDESQRALLNGTTGGVFRQLTARGPTAFVPSRLEDNPHLDREDYAARLSKLPPLLRARLLEGNWTVVEDALIRAEWLRRFRVRGEGLSILDEHGTPIEEISEHWCVRFAVADTASTAEEKVRERSGKSASYSVCGVWDYHPVSRRLFLRDLWRGRVAYVELRSAVAEIVTRWTCPTLLIEGTLQGSSLADDLLHRGVPARSISTSIKGERANSAKLDRAIASGLFSALQEGRLLLPESAAWLHGLEGEWLGWSGDPAETSDQIDVASHACAYAPTVGSPSEPGAPPWRRPPNLRGFRRAGG